MLLRKVFVWFGLCVLVCSRVRWVKGGRLVVWCLLRVCLVKVK